MRKNLIAATLILCLVALGVWWLLFNGTGTVDNGVQLMNSHQRQVEEIFRVAEKNQHLEGVWVSSSCSSVRGDCATITRLMEQLPASSLNLERDPKSGKLDWAKLELFRGSLWRPPVEAEWSARLLPAHGAASECRNTMIAGWSVCPGEVAWP